MQRFRRVLFSCLLLSSILAQEAVADFYYRYRDDTGSMRIGYSVPPEFVGNGYEVLNDHGAVVDVVLPQSDQNEHAGKVLQEAEARHQKKLQFIKDEVLLRFYSSPEDVERLRERKLSELQTFIDIQKANVLTNRQRLVELQSQAADMELSGQKISETILGALNTLVKKISDAQQAIVLKEEEKKSVWLAFQLDIERLNELLGESKGKPELGN